MWIFTFFDLPTATKAERKAYERFRKFLLKDGFTMLQYSVYIRHCPSVENAEVHQKRVQSALPKAGKVSMMLVTDKQFGMIKHFWGKSSADPPDAPQQIEMF